MARRPVQYGVVNMPAADVPTGAPGFRATWQSNADLRDQLMAIDGMPNNGKVFFWDGQVWLDWDAPDDLPGPDADPLRIKVVGRQGPGLSTGGGEDDKLSTVIQLLEPLSHAAAERLSRTHVASSIQESELRLIRRALGTKLAPDKDVAELLGSEVEQDVEPFGNDFYEPQQQPDYAEKLRQLAPAPHGYEWRDMRGHPPLEIVHNSLTFPISGTNGPVFKTVPWLFQLKAILGVELKSKLTWAGVRQAEMEYYLWAYHSDYPFIQLITDLERGGMIFFSSSIQGTSRTAQNADLRKQKCIVTKVGGQSVSMLINGLVDNTQKGHRGLLVVGQDGSSIVQQKVFTTMSQMQQHLAALIAALPADLGKDLPDESAVIMVRGVAERWVSSELDFWTSAGRGSRNGLQHQEGAHVSIFDFLDGFAQTFITNHCTN